jgi:DNA uptake protein ComE-like DNA-binding protein
MSARPIHRGVVLLTVLVVVTVGALIGTTVLYLADARIASATATLKQTQSRALAWSGVQGVMAELLTQRDQLLLGETPHITDEWMLFTTGMAGGGAGGGGRGVVRVTPIGPENERIMSEAGKLDVNHATAEMLAQLPGVDEALAERIIAARGSGFASVEQLLKVEGMTPALLYGGSDGEDIFYPEGDEPLAFQGEVPMAEGPGRPLIDLLTVFSFEPNVQLGLGEDGGDHRGVRRININTPWSDRLGEAIERRFNADIANGVKRVMERGTTFKKDADVIKVLRLFKVEPKDWVEILDVFCTTPDPYRLGRVDLNVAPEEVLVCIPGVDRAAATWIVSVRERLDSQTRQSVVWPVLEGILSEEQFEQAVDSLTTRSMQWRVRVEAGILPADVTFGGVSVGDSGGINLASVDEDQVGLTLRGPGELGEDRLKDRVVLDAVVDVSARRPRIAYLRDVTQLATAMRLRALAAEVGGEEPGVGGEGGELENWGEWYPEDDLALTDDLEMAPPMDDGLDLGMEAERAMDAGAPNDTSHSPTFSESGADSAGTGETSGSGGEVDEGRDRRIGRWTSGGGS